MKNTFPAEHQQAQYSAGGVNPCVYTPVYVSKDITKDKL